jgi:hypothetical protein
LVINTKWSVVEMSTLRVMVPPVEPSSWSERPAVAAYRAQVRRRLMSEELERRAALKLAPSPRVAEAARQEPDDRFAPCPANPWGEVKLPSPWRPEQPAALSPGDFAPFPEPDWSQLRRVEPGSRSEPEPDPVRRRRVAPDLGYAPFKPSPWER